MMLPTSRPFLSIVVPAYDEERRLPESLQKIKTYLDARKLDAEILVVDDGSSDATPAAATEALRGRRGRVVRHGTNRGKGAAVRTGLKEAAGRFALVTDADLSTPIEEYDKLAAAMRDGELDVAIGSRAHPEADVQVRQSWLRQSMGRTFNTIIRVLTGLPFQDTQCGFKLFDRERILPIVDKAVVDRFAYDVELLYVAHRFHLAIREIPVVWRNAPGSKVSIVGDPVNMILDVIRVRWRFRRGLYNPDVEAVRAT